MTRHIALGLGAAFVIAGLTPTPAAAPAAASCASLASAVLPDTTIRSAEEIAGPSFTPPGGTALTGLPAFCRVTGVTKPAVNFEVWLPTTGWNGKFQGVGNGANAGSISYPAMAAAVKRGYATASTDTGHTTRNARDAAWAVGHPELMADFGYRAIHLTAQHGKQLVQAFYGQPSAHAYFQSCSTGGRQALMEAQRFPDDYDGIIAGDPAANWTRFQTGGHLWVAMALNKDPESYIPASKLPFIDNAVTAACDAIDGVKDGILDDPRKCRFDPQTLACRAGQDGSTCLTDKQVKAVKDIWTGPRTSAGREIYPPYMPGAESAAGGWNAYMSGSGPRSGNHWEQSDNVLRFMIFENPSWDFRTFDFDRDLEPALKKLGETMDAFNPDLSRFRQRGGKLLMYHGWNDASISPLNTINYYESVVARLQGSRPRQQAEADAQAFVRLFMVPGMLHCGGGPGPNSFDMLTALETWVEKGAAPERVIASHSTNGVQDRTRPLCVYPKVAAYNGTGSIDEAANFTCRAEAARSAAAGAPQSGAGSSPPTVTGPIPSVSPGDPSRDYPFYASAVDLKSRGYVEAEFFIEGTAKRYTTPPQANGTVVDDGHRYKTRVVVRRPTAPEKFNGTVLVEWNNVTAGRDLDIDWFQIHDHLTANGYAWVGVTPQRVGVGALQAWNEKRYGTLDVTDGGAITNDDLSYDIFAAAATAIRHPGPVNIMGGLRVERILATGHSQSAGRLATYVNSVHPLAPRFEAVILHGGGAGVRTDLTIPVWKLLAETDVILSQAAIRQPDTKMFRTWEVAGDSHVDVQFVSYSRQLSQRDGNPVAPGFTPGLGGRGGSPAQPASAAPAVSAPPAAAARPGEIPRGNCERPSYSRIPFHYVMAAAVDHLVTWVKTGTPPPSAPPIEVTSPGPPATIARDERGNARGGIRLSQHEVATGVNTGQNSGPGFCRLNGSYEPFDAATLTRLYPTHDAYVAAVRAVTDRNLKAGYILKTAAEATMTEARQAQVGR